MIPFGLLLVSVASSDNVATLEACHFTQFYLQNSSPQLRTPHSQLSAQAADLLHACVEADLQSSYCYQPCLSTCQAIEERLAWAGVPVTAIFPMLLVTDYETMHTVQNHTCAYYEEVLDRGWLCTRASVDGG